MARVLIVIGSRREGNSFKFATKLKEKLLGNRISVDFITPGNQKIYLCTGCMDCDRNGVCDFKDDMADNISKVLNSDYIIFVSPTRWDLLSGDIKIFLDRLNPLYSTKKLSGKKMIAIAIGSKKICEYSVAGAITSLGLFADSSCMQMVYKHEFGSCLNSDDITMNEDLDKVVNEIVEIIQ